MDLLDEEVQNAFGSDMMSEVLAYVQDQGILMTGLVNEQIIRTAAMKDMFCVVMVRGKQPTAEMISIAEENSDDNGWISSSLLGNLLGKQYPDFDVRNFRYKKFVPFVESLGLFETRRESLNVFFRLKSEK